MEMIKEAKKTENFETFKNFLSESELAKAIIWEAYFCEAQREKFYANKFKGKYGGTYDSVWRQFERLFGTWLFCGESPRGRKLGKTWRMIHDRFLSLKVSLKRWKKDYRQKLVEASKHPEILHFAYLLFDKVGKEMRTIGKLEKILREDFQSSATGQELRSAIEFVLRLFQSYVQVKFKGGGGGGAFYYGIRREKLPIIASNMWRYKIYLKDGRVITPNLWVDPRINSPMIWVGKEVEEVVYRARSLGIKTRLEVPETPLDFPWVLLTSKNGKIRFPEVCKSCKKEYPEPSNKVISNIDVIGNNVTKGAIFMKHASQKKGALESCSKGVMELKSMIEERTGRSDVMIFWNCPKGKRYFEIDLRMFIPTVHPILLCDSRH
ncbi:MAG: hypothetical protein AVW06_01960 [Hadesarchaea archaeon DG-33-1]|nr:MAG: hypothetical protein AVW06_01960 [Hadesarchaea archaeon DG-33-1]